jgi:hypothetical protein
MIGFADPCAIRSPLPKVPVLFSLSHIGSNLVFIYSIPFEGAMFVVVIG